MDVRSDPKRGPIEVLEMLAESVRSTTAHGAIARAYAAPAWGTAQVPVQHKEGSYIHDHFCPLG